MAQFHIEIIITSSVLFLAMVVLFRSLAFAVISIVTMALTVTITFGIVTAMFTYDWLHSAWPELQHVDKWFWLIVVLAFSVTCVLSLDYNVFLIVRILEYRYLGHTNQNAVVAAVGATGPIISFAAVIMMVAFGALMFSNTIMMNQFGITLTIAVFIDAFLVRPLVVPAFVMMFPGRSLWWPRSVPHIKYSNGDSARTLQDEEGAVDADATRNVDDRAL